MRIPTLQIIRGEIDPTSENKDSFVPIGIGIPEKDPDSLIMGHPKTMYRGTYALSCSDPAFTWEKKPWSIQLYGLPDNIFNYSNFRDFCLIANKSFPSKLGSVALQLYKDCLVYQVTNTENAPTSSVVRFPEELQSGEHYYRLSHDGYTLRMWIDDTLIVTWNLPITTEENDFVLLGVQGDNDFLIRGMHANMEFFRFDANHVLQPEEFYYFPDEKSRDVALSFFDPENVHSQDFDGVKLEDVLNYSPELSAIDLIEATGSARVVPVMTEPTTAGFSVTANSQWSDAFQVKIAFQDNIYETSECWASANSLPTPAAPHVITIGFPEKMAFNGFSISKRSSLSGFPTHFFLEGLADSGEWDIIKEYVDTDPDSRTFYGMDFGVVANYSQVRFRIVENDHEVRPQAVFYTAIANIQLFMVTGRAGTKTFRYTDWSMSRTVLAQSGKPTEGIHIANVFVSNTNAPSIDGYVIENRTYGQASVIQGPKDWILQGRNPGGEWVDVDVQTGNGSPDSGVRTEIALDKVYRYQEWRLVITECHGGHSFVSVGKLELNLNGQLQYTPMTGYNSGTQVASSSSEWADKSALGWMAFDGESNVGWASAIRPTSSEPQWISIDTLGPDKSIIVQSSNGDEHWADGLTDNIDTYSYPEGNGYLIDEGQTKKFIPVEITGFLVSEEEGKKVLSYTSVETITPSVEKMTTAEVTKTTGGQVHELEASASWVTRTMTGTIDGQPFDMATDVLPPGEYYGTLSLSTNNKKHSALRIVNKTNDSVLQQLLSTFTDGYYGSTALSINNVFIKQLTEGLIGLEVFSTAGTATSGVGVLYDHLSIVVSELRLFKVA